MGMRIAELIRQETHPAVNLVLRALAHVKDKIEDGADVNVLYGNDYLVVETKKAKLIIKKIELDNVDRVKLVFIKVNKSCEGSTKVIAKQYMIRYDKQILADLIYEIDYIVEDAILSGAEVIDDKIDSIVATIKTLADEEGNTSDS